MIVGIGIDIVDIDRMKLAIERTPGIVKKILTSQEYDYLQKYSDEQFVFSLAARFATKEAVVKSLGLPLFEVGLQNITIFNDEKTGAPAVSIKDQNLISSHIGKDVTFLCSLTHSAKSAAAVVVAQNNSGKS